MTTGHLSARWSPRLGARTLASERGFSLVVALLLPSLALLTFFAAAYARHAFALIAFPLDLDQGEGYDAWSAWLINLGSSPYPDASTYPYYFHGYPPVWSYLVSIPMAWLGPGLLPARAVSAAATALVAVMLARAASQRSRSKLAGVLAAGFFLASPYVFHTTALARVNSTTLLLAVLAITLAEKLTPLRLCLAVVSLVLALFTKPTAFDAAAAVLGYVLLRRPAQGIRTGVGFAILGGLSLATALVLTHGGYWVDVLASNSSAFDLNQFLGYTANFVFVHPVLLALAMLELFLVGKSRNVSVWDLYFLAALALALVTCGKSGAGESYFLAPVAGASVLAAGGVVRLVSEARFRHSALQPLLAATLFAQTLLLAHDPLSQWVSWLPDRGFQAAFLGADPSAADGDAASRLIEAIEERGGPILAEDASPVVAAGQPIVGATPPSLRNLYHAGLWDPSPLTRDVLNRRFKLVVLDAQMYPEPVLQAIGRAYYLDRQVTVHGTSYQFFLPGTD